MQRGSNASRLQSSTLVTAPTTTHHSEMHLHKCAIHLAGMMFDTDGRNVCANNAVEVLFDQMLYCGGSCRVLEHAVHMAET